MDARSAPTQVIDRLEGRRGLRARKRFAWSMQGFAASMTVRTGGGVARRPVRGVGRAGRAREHRHRQRRPSASSASVHADGIATGVGRGYRRGGHRHRHRARRRTDRLPRGAGHPGRHGLSTVPRGAPRRGLVRRWPRARHACRRHHRRARRTAWASWAWRPGPASGPCACSTPSGSGTTAIGHLRHRLGDPMARRAPRPAHGRQHEPPGPRRLPRPARLRCRRPRHPRPGAPGHLHRDSGGRRVRRRGRQRVGRHGRLHPGPLRRGRHRGRHVRLRRPARGSLVTASGSRGCAVPSGREGDDRVRELQQSRIGGRRRGARHLCPLAGPSHRGDVGRDGVHDRHLHGHTPRHGRRRALPRGTPRRGRECDRRQLIGPRGWTGCPSATPTWRPIRTRPPCAWSTRARCCRRARASAPGPADRRSPRVGA